LCQVLQGKQGNPPYVLVGQSLGGIHIRVYQSLYPVEIWFTKSSPQVH